jgi:hypothetical protein
MAVNPSIEWKSCPCQLFFFKLLIYIAWREEKVEDEEVYHTAAAAERGKNVLSCCTSNVIQFI